MASVSLSLPSSMLTFDAMEKPEFTRTGGGTLVKVAHCDTRGKVSASGYDAVVLECCFSLAMVHINESSSGFYAGSVRIRRSREAAQRARLVLLRMDPAERAHRRETAVSSSMSARFPSRAAPPTLVRVKYSVHPFHRGTTLARLRNGDGIGVLAEDGASFSTWTVFAIPQVQHRWNRVVPLPLHPLGMHPISNVLKEMRGLTRTDIEERLAELTGKPYTVGPSQHGVLTPPLESVPAVPAAAAAATVSADAQCSDQTKSAPPSPDTLLLGHALCGLLLLKRARLD